MITIESIISFLIVAVVVLVILKLISLPIKILIKVLVNLLLGGALLFALSYFGIITIELTWWMAAIVGVLGVPGAIIVVLLSLFIL